MSRNVRPNTWSFSNAFKKHATGTFGWKPQQRLNMKKTMRVLFQASKSQLELLIMKTLKQTKSIAYDSQCQPKKIPNDAENTNDLQILFHLRNSIPDLFRMILRHKLLNVTNPCAKRRTRVLQRFWNANRRIHIQKLRNPA